MLSVWRMRALHGFPLGRTPLPSWLVNAGGAATTGTSYSLP
jgi:hypothetical protein